MLSKKQHIRKDISKRVSRQVPCNFHIRCAYELLSGEIRPTDRPHAGCADSSNRGPFTQLGPVGTICLKQTCEDKSSAIMWALVKVFWLQHLFAGFLLTDCELPWSWGVDMPFLPLPKMQRAGIGFGRFTMWGGFAIGKCRSVPRIPNSWCIVFFWNELSQLFKSHMMRSFDWPMGARHNKRKMANERRAQLVLSFCRCLEYLNERPIMSNQWQKEIWSFKPLWVLKQVMI